MLIFSFSIFSGEILDFETAKEAVLQHAKEVSEPGIYIDIVDLILFAFMENVNLKLLQNIEGELPQPVPMKDYVEGLGLKWPEKKDSTEKDPERVDWHILITRADYQPARLANLCSMNHFMPIWRSSPEMIRIETERVVADQHSTCAALKMKLMDVQDDWHAQGKDRNDEELDFIMGSVLEDIRFNTQKFEDLAELVKRFGTTPCPDEPQMVWLAKEALADGNCGLWTLIALSRPEPEQAMIFDDSMYDKMMQMRATLSAGWVSVSEDPLWHILFHRFAHEKPATRAPPRNDREEAAEIEQKIKRRETQLREAMKPSPAEVAKPSNKRRLVPDVKMEPKVKKQIVVKREQQDEPAAKRKEPEPSDPSDSSNPLGKSGNSDTAPISQPLPLVIPKKPKSERGAASLFKKPKTEQMVKDVKEEDSDWEVDPKLDKHQREQKKMKKMQERKTQSKQEVKNVRPYKRASDDAKKQKRYWQAFRNVLARDCNLTYKHWHGHHSNSAPIKGAAECSGGGWRSMLERLRDERMPECESCQNLLREKKIQNEEHLRKLVEAVDAYQIADQVLVLEGEDGEEGANGEGDDAGVPKPPDDPEAMPDDPDDCDDDDDFLGKMGKKCLGD